MLGQSIKLRLSPRRNKACRAIFINTAIARREALILIKPPYLPPRLPEPAIYTPNGTLLRRQARRSAEWEGGGGDRHHPVQAAQPRKGVAHVPAGGLGTQLWWPWRSPPLPAQTPGTSPQISPLGPPAGRGPSPGAGGSTLLRCRSDPIAAAEAHSPGKDQGLAHGSRGLLSPCPPGAPAGPGPLPNPSRSHLSPKGPALCRPHREPSRWRPTPSPIHAVH